MIYCLSVHHTGTWSAIEWLTAHEDIKGFLQQAHVNKILMGGKMIHKIDDFRLEAKFHPLMVYHEHVVLEGVKFTPAGFLPDQWWERMISASQTVMISTTPTLIPIRDPLASLITYQKWGERDGRIDGGDFSQREQINHWCGLAVSHRNLKLFGHCRFLCWDLLNGTPEETEEYLLDISRNLGLKDPSPSKDVSHFKRVVNSVGDYPLKQAYLNGDVDAVRRGLSESAFDVLMERESLLRPFLEELGYTDLMWWT